MEEDILNCSQTVMFRGTPCMFMGNYHANKKFLVKGDVCRKLKEQLFFHIFIIYHYFQLLMSYIPPFS